MTFFAYQNPESKLVYYIIIASPLITFLVCISLGFVLQKHKSAQRTLQENKEKLSNTLESLTKTQEQLARSEKLASLGGLVASIVHELNTPIGNTMLAASTLSDDISTLKNTFDSGSLKKSSLEEFIELALKTIALIQNNTNSTNELIKNFKQVAVDQTSERRRTFDLKSVFEELIWVLTPQIKRTPYIIKNLVIEGLILDSYPGALGQIITNLINNSIIHGFEKRSQGTITVKAEEVDGDIRIVYEDDGDGIPEDKLQKIFDPFYTTKLSKGGSGLGLNIVKSLITDLLGGKIEVESELQKGTTFIIQIPKKAPEESGR
ncbi:sensor histidine kinase [Aliikangiella coralliicola]|nr:HAMP domain-containing sensor histidine kinase [Aliikangiella coralliicola]